MSPQACIDASLALLWLLPTQTSVAADRLKGEWEQEGVELLSAPLFQAEVTSVLRRNVFLGRLLPQEGEELFTLSQLLPINVRSHEMLQRRAWELAVRFNRPTTYDAQYLALADLLGCELWTSDERLLNALGGQIPWVRFLSAASP